MIMIYHLNNRYYTMISFSVNPKFRRRQQILFLFIFSTLVVFMIFTLSKRVISMSAVHAKRFKGVDTHTKGGRMIWIDCEMTGLNLDKHELVEIAVIVTESDLSIVEVGPDLIIHQPQSVLDLMDDWCLKTFSKNGLLDRIKSSNISLAVAESQILEFVRVHTDAFVCPLAGNSVSVDRKFIDKSMPSLSKHLHYRTIDVSTVKELCKRWYPAEYCTAPPKANSHRALDDIRESIQELQFYREKIFIK